MVETQSKTVSQTTTERPPLRTPPKRAFSDTQGAPPKQLGVGQLIEGKETLRPTQRRRVNPPQPRLDAKAMIKLVPALSERELKQLVNTIVRRKKREEGAKNRRPSETTSARGKPAVEPQPPTQTDNVAPTRLPRPEQRPVEELIPMPRETTLGPGGPLESIQTMEMKTLKDSHRAEESILASALLRQANRHVFLSILFSCNYFIVHSIGTFFPNKNSYI